MIHITCVIKVGTVTEPTNAHKYIEISLGKQWTATCFGQPCVHLQEWSAETWISSLYKLISIYLCAFVGTVIVCSGRTLSNYCQPLFGVTTVPYAWVSRIRNVVFYPVLPKAVFVLCNCVFLLASRTKRGVGWHCGLSAALLVGRSRDRFPMVSLDFSETYSDRTMALGSTQPLVKMSTRNISWG